MSMDEINRKSVLRSYRRWAPVYDLTFGAAAKSGQRLVVDRINQSSGRVLEVGVGTGLSLPLYAPHLQLEGIDLSTEMLDRARKRVSEQGLHNVVGLHEMDAENLDFPDDTFDTVVGMYVITVVPDAEKAMKEMTRVCRPGGQVFLVNHYSSKRGVMAQIERLLEHFSSVVGFHALFEPERVLACPGLSLLESKPVGPLDTFTMMRFQKEAASEMTASNTELRLSIAVA